MGRQSHALVIPFPAQGHVAPLMKLSLQIAAHGVKVTFVNTDFIHEKVLVSLSGKSEEHNDPISLVSLPDGLELEDDRTDFVKLLESIRRTMPGRFEDLILKINQSNEKITCVIADTSVGWGLEVAKKVGIEAVAVWPAGGPCLALALHVPQLLEAKITDYDGTMMKDEPISVSNDVLAWNSSEIGWGSSDPVMQKIGLELAKDGNGIVTRHEVSAKIDALLSSDVIKGNSLHVKDLARKSFDDGGSSFRNFNNFIEHIKSKSRV
ncbi:UDP-glucuronosyl/UDP-glucosyltransferase [Corchorus olitorius]|uniref:UDP-glucuronosyl/UDP-glucosyltransferase n=1 Tax=Corchorus olitorius TaxID=93759 RepID=A0A1R3G0L8_9ROSI|nr:UDP-glucuronosyl/UDP-glucosyltransferase [Corchorus olitorius]